MLSIKKEKGTIGTKVGKSNSMIKEYTTASLWEEDFSELITARAPFGYYGAKQRLAKKIISMLPKHNAWVEGFCGSAAITLAKSPAPIEVINDLDGRIVNFFNQLRNNKEKLCRAVALTPYAVEEFKLAQQKLDKNISPLEDARRFLITTMMTINGTVDPKGAGFSYSSSYSRNGREARVNRWCNLPNRLECVVERLRRVRVERRDARDLMDMFKNRPATLAYLDPPYFTKRQHRYVIDTGDLEFHKQLLEILVKAKCMIILSGYDNSFYQQTLVDNFEWKKHIISTTTRDTTGVDYPRNEILWTNPQFNHSLKTGRVPIRLSKTEKTHKKVNPERNY